MDLIRPEEIHGTTSGHHLFPFKVLERLNPNVLLHTADAYAKLVEAFPEYEIGMTRDDSAEILKVYWKVRES